MNPLKMQVMYPDSVDDADIVIPGKKKRDEDAEWRTQARCVTILRKIMRTDPMLTFIAPMAESPRTTQRAAMAKMLGLQRGVPDIWLFRRVANGVRICVVELKRPGGRLSAEQVEWFNWLQGAGVPCHRCDSVEGFREILAGF